MLTQKPMIRRSAQIVEVHPGAAANVWPPAVPRGLLEALCVLDWRRMPHDLRDDFGARHGNTDDYPPVNGVGV